MAGPNLRINVTSSMQVSKTELNPKNRDLIK